MDPKKVPYVKHNDGSKMPAIGLGTFKSLGGECERAVKFAIDAGYRHIDTAYFYENEHEVGNAVRQKISEGCVKREDLFIVSKLWCHFHEPERVEYAMRLSLKNFGLDYLDCYLMHWPYSYVHINDTEMYPADMEKRDAVLMSDVDYLDTYRAMEKLVEKGLTKSIGVSNFNSEQLTRILENCTVKPIHDQIEYHPELDQKKLIKFCTERDIIVTAYCPLGHHNAFEKTPKFLYDERVQAIARKYEKTPAQVVLRYTYENGAVPIPKSSDKSRIHENISIFDFELTPEEHKLLDTFNANKRIVEMSHARANKNYPFNIEY